MYCICYFRYTRIVIGDILRWQSKYYLSFTDFTSTNQQEGTSPFRHAPSCPIVSTVSRSEPDVFHRLIHQHAVLGLEVELHILLRFQADGEEDAVALQSLAVADVHKGGIERLHAVGVQAVVRQVAHVGHGVCLNARKLVCRGIVGQGKAEGIDSVQALASHHDVDGLSGLVGLLDGAQRHGALQGIGPLGRNTAIQGSGHDRDVIGINQAITVQVAIADVAFEVGIPLTQSGVVGVGRQVILVQQAVMVDVARQIALRIGHLEDVQFTTRTEVAHGLGDMQAYIACGGLSAEGEHLHTGIAMPLERAGFRPVLLVHTVADGTLQQSAVACILARHILEFIQLADGVQVGHEVEGHGRSVIGRVPQFTLLEIEEAAQRTSLVADAGGTRDAADGKLQGIGFRSSLHSPPASKYAAWCRR